MNDDASQAFAGMTGFGPRTKETPSSGWSKIDRAALSKSVLTAPKLTDEMLPKGWADWVRGTSDDTNSPIGYVALGLITAGASAIGNTRIVVATESWFEPCVLWGMLVGPPSVRKSTSQRPHREAIANIERAETIAHDQECKRLNQNHEATGGKPKTLILPPIPRWLVNDATIEAVAERSAENPRGLYVYFDELASWFGSFGRYGNDLGDRGFYLAAYDASRHIRDRQKNQGKKPIVVERLNLSICGAMVAEKLNQVFNYNVNDGLISR
jgi:hypothetical protein